MADTVFRMLDDRPADYVPLGSSRAFIVKVNQFMSLLARHDGGSFKGQRLTAITPKLRHKVADELMAGKPFVGVDGISYIIQS